MFGSSPTVATPQINPVVAQQLQRAQGFLNSPWFQETAPAVQQPTSPQEGPRMYSDGLQGWNQPDDGSGFASNVPRSLIGTESGGNWNAQNNETGAGGAKGHFGILQFGQARLNDAKRAGVIPTDMTPQQFKNSQPAQVAASNWHFDDIDSRIRKSGFDKMVGQNVGGVTMSWNGMRAIAHLGGFGGLSKFINTGGRYNPADAYGTSLAAYGKKHHG